MERSGDANDVSGKIRKMGALYQISNDKSEGIHHSVRTLIELGTIEVIGKMLQIPYWECLDIKSTNPEAQKILRDWYVAFEHDDLMRFVQTNLSLRGYYTGPVDGINNASISRAIVMFKADNGLTGDSSLDYSLYYHLAIDDANIPKQRMAILESDYKIRETSNNTERLKPMELFVTTDFGSQHAVYKAGENINISVKTTTDAYVYCYYGSNNGNVIKIFPNRYRPSGFVNAGETVGVTGENFTMTANKTENESDVLLCMASNENIDERTALADKDLQELQMGGVENISNHYRRVIPIGTSLPIVTRVTIDVL